ncbi:MAG: hypothetical protein WC086_01565 [Dehalococcoidales bacterium]
MVKTISIAVVALLLGAAAAGVPLWIQLGDAKDQIEGLQAEKTSLVQQVGNLEDDLSDANNTILGLNNDLGSLQAIYDSTSIELDETRAMLELKIGELADANSQIENLNGELATANQDIENLSRDLAAANSQIDTLGDDLASALLDIENLNAELSAIEEKYPLEDFADYTELSAWVKLHLQPYSSSYDSWFSHALKVQEQAANDGYYVSAFIFASDDSLLVVNCALAGNMLYVWDPEDPELYEWWEGGR